MTGEKMVRGSGHVVVARIEGRKVEWNPQHTLILTSYTLDVEESLKGQAPDRIEISVPGGTIDGETHESCVSIHLEMGGRYLLFLTDLEQRTFVPVVGAWQGVFRELPEKNGGMSRVAAGPSATEIRGEDGEALSFRDLVEMVRGLIAHVAASPKLGSEDGAAALFRQELPAKVYDLAAAFKELLPRVPESAPEPDVPFLPVGEEPSLAARENLSTRPRAGSPAGLHEKHLYQYKPTAPIVINQLLPGTPFSPLDQYQMSAWNTYGKNLFRVHANPTAQWAFGNGVFDLAGFPDDAAMVQQFGRGWGRDVLGVTWLRFNSVRIVEADIALNPAFLWTPSEEVGTQIFGDFHSFNQTMLHELGHVWGLRHPWETQDVWWDSVMNYAPKAYRAAKLFADDTTAVRKAFPGTKLRDALISSYVTQDSPDSQHAAYFPVRPASSLVFAGSALLLTGSLQIENTGTSKIAKPSFEVYLTPTRFSWAGAIYLGTVRTKSVVKPNGILRIGFAPGYSLRVPGGTPRGTYHLGFFIRDPKDRFQGNNSAWSDSNVSVTVE
jgi:hypothetical protein